jgi:hypothetical protein
MEAQTGISTSDFNKALEIGRPPNIETLFPNSRALIVSGKVIDRAMIAKGHAIAIAASVRSSFVARGALRAAQKANAAILIEIAKSEGGRYLQRIRHHRPCCDPRGPLRHQESQGRGKSQGGNSQHV